MKKIKEIIYQVMYQVRLNSIDKKLTKNAEDIRNNFGTSQIELDNVKDNLDYNHYRLEQLRLMSCRGYLENKLTHVTK